jgi:hypothetical protein
MRNTHVRYEVRRCKDGTWGIYDELNEEFVERGFCHAHVAEEYIIGSYGQEYYE